VTPGPFTRSHHCRSGAHCGTCRDRDGGRAWRASLASLYVLPPAAPDFACPHGRAWGQAGRGEPVADAGPGTELKKLFGRFGIAAGGKCGCDARAAAMDARGCDWCAANVETIVGWVRVEAGRRGVPFVAFAARLLIRRAIANARRTARRPTASPMPP
jgi:hypothetical protein